jgi:high-affinity Fe2+/Pb2+ permease
MHIPIVEYAHKIGKNTRDFTVNDMVKFTKWWLKQPVREDLLKMGKIKYTSKAKPTVIVAEDVNEEETVFEDMDEVQEEVEEEQEEQEEVQKEQDEEVALQIGLSVQDVEALKWAIIRVNEDYDMSEHEYGIALNGIKEALDTVEL